MHVKNSPSYTNPKLDLRACSAKGGYGVFARELVRAGELLSIWGGEIYTEKELDLIPAERAQHGIQVEEKMYLVPLTVGDVGDYYNHSCDPNAGLSGQICLVAMRDIPADEEVCFDYAMSDSSDYDEFVCHCGSVHCRQRVTGNDWRLPDLHVRYAGYFMPYLQRRINQLYQKKNFFKHYPDLVIDSFQVRMGL